MIKPAKLSPHKVWLSTKDYIIIVFATLLYAASFCGFILPQKVVIGGVTGVGTLVFFLTGIPVAITQYAVNLILLAFAFKIVGKRFVTKTIFGATCLSIFMGILQPVMTHYFPEGLVPGQTFMCILIGGFITGLALGLVFVHNGSTGGTDIVCAIVAKKSNAPIGRTMLYVDFCIIFSSFLLFHNIDTVVYGLIILFVSAYICDMIINSSRRAVQFMIISPQWEQIADAINRIAHRGCTVINGKGWYSKNDLKILMVVCRIQESVMMYRIIQSVDPHAFILQNDTHGVYGQGFDELKIKSKPLEIEKPVGAAAPSHLERNVEVSLPKSTPGGHPSRLA